MDSNKKIKVLIVDDSLVFREALSRGITVDPYIEVVAKAVDPFDARDKIIQFKPDVVTCDVEMPKMNGIEFIRRLLPQYPIPVIVVSTISNAVFDAMSAGAVDFVTKPIGYSSDTIDIFFNELITKIKIAANAKVVQHKIETKTRIVDDKQSGNVDIIAIGASTGGTEAIANILSHLPSNVPGIVVVQHIPPVFSKMFAERLDNQSQLEVKEAETGDIVMPGKVFIAPGDRHIRIKKIGNDYVVECFEGDKVNWHCPSVDVLFESVANVAENHAIGIILTGMGKDGAKGLLSMREKGARTIGQDEDSSVVYGMPKVAFDIGAVEKQVPLTDIPELLFTMIR